MSIDKHLLYSIIEKKLRRTEPQLLNTDLDFLLWLIHKVIFNNPVENCFIKVSKKEWCGLPADKSLFNSSANTGLPIGNLTSQLFANIYLNEFDQYIKNDLQIKYYGRYVDDLIFVSRDKNYLGNLVSFIRIFLKNRLGLRLHEKKIYLKSIKEGVLYLGAFVKPSRIYVGNRTKCNFYQKVSHWNKLIAGKDFKFWRDKLAFLSSINSYLGIVKHYNSYNLRKNILKAILNNYFRNYFYFSSAWGKIVSRIKK